MHRTLAEIAEMVGGRLSGNGQRVVTGVTSLEFAGEDDISFARDASQVESSGAGAVIVPEGTELPGRDVIHHPHPQAAIRTLLLREYADPDPEPGVSEHAVVHATARLGDGVYVGPNVVVEADAELGDRVQVHAGAYVGRGAVIGVGTRVFANAVIHRRVRIGANCNIRANATIGQEGFGYIQLDGRHEHVPQIGGVIIGDDVDVGASSCVDAGSFVPTRVGNNAKIDNLVMVAHNCDVGAGVFLCSQAGLAGGTTVGDGSVLGGQVGSVGHLAIGRGVRVAGRTMVTNDVPDGAVVGGVPHMDVRRWRRSTAVSRSLPELRQEVRALRKRIEELEGA